MFFCLTCQAQPPVVVLHNIAGFVNAIVTIYMSFGNDVRSMLNGRDRFVLVGAVAHLQIGTLHCCFKFAIVLGL